MIVRTPEELEILREGGRHLAAILNKVIDAVMPGVATVELDRLAERLIREAGGEPAFKGYRSHSGERPFPASLCTSINDEVVHAIPRPDKILKSGDVIGLDIGMRWPSVEIRNSKFEIRNSGLITDMAATVPVGKISPEAELLIAATRRALEAGIALLKPGMRLGDLGHAIQRRIEGNGFSVVRDLGGHGVGRSLHEEPYIPNYGLPGEGILIKEGMVLAIEPMAAIGGCEVILDKDGWAWRTKDGSLAAHFEHTAVITAEGVEILTKV